MRTVFRKCTELSKIICCFTTVHFFFFLLLPAESLQIFWSTVDTHAIFLQNFAFNVQKKRRRIILTNPKKSQKQFFITLGKKKSIFFQTTLLFYIKRSKTKRSLITIWLFWTAFKINVIKSFKCKYNYFIM